MVCQILIFDKFLIGITFGQNLFLLLQFIPPLIFFFVLYVSETFEPCPDDFLEMAFDCEFVFNEALVSRSRSPLRYFVSRKLKKDKSKIFQEKVHTEQNAK